MSATKPKEATARCRRGRRKREHHRRYLRHRRRPGGLAVATAAAAFGRSVVLIERHKIGGDALNYGCVPSRAMAAVANRAHAMRSAGIFGMIGRTPRSIRARSQLMCRALSRSSSRISPPSAMSGLGVRVIRAAGRFINKKTVVAGEYRIKARRFVIATGSTPLVPAIPGLDSVPYFTNETIFDNQERLHSLIIIGGGANALELAQSHQPPRLACDGPGGRQGAPRRGSRACSCGAR